MKLKLALRVARLILLAALVVQAGIAVAQSYPSRPIRVVVGFPPGGQIDQVARLIGSKMTTELNQPVIVESRPGAGGNIGAGVVAKSVPDGHTLLISPSNLAIAPSIYRSLSFDAMKDLAPISQLCATFLILVVNSKVPVNSVGELIGLAKSRPAKLNYGHAGLGSTLHLNMELFNTLARVDILAVPYKGTAPLSNALLSAEVELAFMPMETVISHVRGGRLRALGVGAGTRSRLVPDVPTVAEAGVRDFVGVPGWYGLFAPAGTPRDIVMLIHREAVKAMNAPDIRDRLLAMGQELVGSTPEEFEETYKADIAKFSKIVTDARVPMLD